MKGKVNDFVRRIFIYKEDDARGQVDTFVETSNVKIRNKFEFILRYLADEKNQFKEPYVKHFSIEKYKRLYELRLKVTSVMSRIIFSLVGIAGLWSITLLFKEKVPVDGRHRD